MDKCDCTISHRVNGDGCRYCQPQEYIERLSDWINEARDEIATLAKEKNGLEYRLAEAKLHLLMHNALPKITDEIYNDYAGEVFIEIENGKPDWTQAAIDFAALLDEGNVNKSGGEG